MHSTVQCLPQPGLEDGILACTGQSCFMAPTLQLWRRNHHRWQKPWSLCGRRWKFCISLTAFHFIVNLLRFIFLQSDYVRSVSFLFSIKFSSASLCRLSDLCIVSHGVGVCVTVICATQEPAGVCLSLAFCTMIYLLSEKKWLIFVCIWLHKDVRHHKQIVRMMSLRRGQLTMTYMQFQSY